VYKLKSDESDYLKELNQNMDSLSTAVKGCALAALHVTGNHKALNKTISNWDIASLHKMFVLLDAPRKAKQLAKKIQAIECQHPHLLELENVAVDANKRKTSPSENVAEDAPVKKRRRRKIDTLRRQYKELRATTDGHTCQACDSIEDDSMVAELIASASASGSLARKVRTVWAPTLPPDLLEFVMLEMPDKTVWKCVADLVHFQPSNFSVPYFLADIHGDSIPEDSFVHIMRQLMDTTNEDDLVSTFRDVATRFPQIYKSYAFLRTKSKLMSCKEVVETLAENIPIGRAIWYFEELYKGSNKVKDILEKRMQGDKDFFTAATRDADADKVFKYGKLLERILTFQKLHCKKLASLLLEVATFRLGLLKEQYMDSSNNNNKKKVAVFGDASSSMTTAIEAAAIIASIVSTCLEGELSFFNGGLVKSPHERPSSVTETLTICQTIRASGCTSLAASLYPYWEKKQMIDTIVMVTDEEENSACQGYYFADLLRHYQETVNPNVVLVIVRVGEGSRYFQQSLATHGIVDTTTVVIDNYRPDLTKFDALLGTIAKASRNNNNNNNNTKVESGDADEDFVLVDEER